jgi:hypothetical protein
MKNFIQIGLAMLFIPLLSAQQTNPNRPAPPPTNCITPVNNVLFQRRVSAVNELPQANRRVNNLTNFVTQNCISSGQMRELLMLLPDDVSKYIVAKEGYPQIVDKNNFYDVFDAFGTFGMAFRLFEFVLTQGPAGEPSQPEPVVTPPTPPTPPTPTTPAQPTGPQYPDLPYPGINEYLGRTGCNEPMLASSFDRVARGVWQAGSQANRIQQLRTTAIGNCMSVSQIMRLATLIESESARLEFVRAMYATTYDLDQFDRCEFLFTLNNIRQEFAQFLRQQNQPAQPEVVTPVCSVSESEMQEILNSIRRISFDSSRLNQAKVILQSKKCFTTAQIAEIMKLFSFDSGKLDVAKFAWDFCIDTQNYFILNEVFSFDSTKGQLNRFISSKR